MKAKELYEVTTGNKRPDNQIGSSDWHIEYVEWMEKQVENIHVEKLEAKMEAFKEGFNSAFEALKAANESVQKH